MRAFDRCLEASGASSRLEMICFGSGGRNTVDIEVRLPPGAVQTKLGTAVASVFITVHESESLTFRFLEKEALRLFTSYSNQGALSHQSSLCPFGLQSAEHDDGGKVMSANSDVWTVCSSMFRPSFTLVFESVLHLLSDDLIQYMASFLGVTPKVNAMLMLISRRMKRVFSQNSCWRDCELEFAYMPICGAGPSSFKEWLYIDHGLPSYDALRVLRVALLSSRLRIYFGTLGQHRYSTFFPFPFGADTRKNLIVFVSLDSSGHSLFENIHLLLPDSAICGTSKCILPDDVTIRQEKTGVHFCRVQASPETPRMSQIKAIGDDRLQFVLLSTDDYAKHRFGKILLRAQATALCLNTWLNPELRNTALEVEQLKYLYQIYCGESLFESDGSNSLSTHVSPVVVFLFIRDVETYAIHNSATSLKKMIADHTEIVAIEMKSIVQSARKQSCSMREWMVQPCSQSHGLISGVNYLIRASQHVIPN